MNVLPVPLNQLELSEAVLVSPTAHGPAKLPVPHPTRSFWVDSPGANPFANQGSSGPLTRDADICIIGSGITGVSTAYHLSKAICSSAKEGEQPPLRVVMLDARDFCQCIRNFCAVRTEWLA